MFMSEFLEYFVILVLLIVFLLVKCIEVFIGDFNFMILLVCGLVVIYVFQECKWYLIIVQISYCIEIFCVVVCCCLYMLMQFGYVIIDGCIYLLLLKVFIFGYVYLLLMLLVIIVQLIFDCFSEQFYEVCLMVILEGDDVFYIVCLVIFQWLILVDFNVGSWLFVYCISMGCIFFVVLDDDVLYVYFGGVEMQVKISCILYIFEILLLCLVEICCQGWCIVDQELEVGLCLLVVLVCDFVGYVFVVLNVGIYVGWVFCVELESCFLLLLLEVSCELSVCLFI